MIKNKTRFGFITVLLAIIIIGAVALSRKDDIVIVPARKITVLAEVQKPVALKTSIADIVNAYTSNKLNADKIYKDKSIQITGFIKNVDIKLGKMYITFLPEGSSKQEIVIVDIPTKPVTATSLQTKSTPVVATKSVTPIKTVAAAPKPIIKAIVPVVKPTVVVPAKPVITVDLDKTDLTLKIGETTKLIDTVKFFNENNRDVTWSVIGGNDVASVSNIGVITAIGTGTATVRATSVNDVTKYADCAVSVAKPEAIWIDYSKPKTTNLTNKSWDINFNKEIKPASVNNKSVYVATDYEGLNIVPNVEVKLSSDAKQIVVNYDNKELWEMGKTYYIFLTKDIQAEDRGVLVNSIRMKFTLQ